MFSHPRSIVAALGIQEGMVVGDFGAGDGAYVRELSQRVGNGGLVYAFDVQKELVTRLASEARDKKMDNVRPVWADLEVKGSTFLAESSLDVAIVANVLFQIENKEAFLGEIVRVLRPNGRLLIVDWLDSWNHLGPHPDHVVSIDTARTYAEKAGLVFDPFPFDAGEHHYALLFRKKSP